MEHALASLKRDENRWSTSKGIVVSITDFGGPVEFINNTISKNMVFIPSAIFSNNQKFNKSLVAPSLASFRSEKDKKLGYARDAYLEFKRNQTRLLYHYVHLLNYLEPPLQREILRDNFTSQSAIFLKNIQASHIVFENNTFDSNVGIHGGAIQIDNSDSGSRKRDATAYAPFLYLKNNTFSRNMAYFEGNAVYVKGG